MVGWWSVVQRNLRRCGRRPKSRRKEEQEEEQRTPGYKVTDARSDSVILATVLTVAAGVEELK